MNRPNVANVVDHLITALNHIEMANQPSCWWLDLACWAIQRQLDLYTRDDNAGS